MTSYTIRAGAPVTLESNAIGVPYHPDAELVGSGAVLGDQSDATYGYLNAFGYDGPALYGAACARFPPFDLSAIVEDPATLTGYKVWLRADGEPDEFSYLTIQGVPPGDPIVDPSASTIFGSFGPVTTGVRDYVNDFGAYYEATFGPTWGADYGAAILSNLVAWDPYVTRGPIDSLSFFAAYEVWVELTFSGFVPPPVRTAHPTRLYPRDDGYGLSSAPRLYPPSKAGRIVGGYQ